VHSRLLRKGRREAIFVVEGKNADRGIGVFGVCVGLGGERLTRWSLTRL
jgi:hypothetical protein